MQGSRTDANAMRSVIGTTGNWAEPSPAPFLLPVHCKGVTCKLKPS
jgi:hypothetical protein